MKNRRKRFVIYPPNYVPGDDEYYNVCSRFKAIKLMRKLGYESKMDVRLFERHRDGNISFCNIIESYIFTENGAQTNTNKKR